MMVFGISLAVVVSVCAGVVTLGGCAYALWANGLFDHRPLHVGSYWELPSVGPVTITGVRRGYEVDITYRRFDGMTGTSIASDFRRGAKMLSATEYSLRVATCKAMEQP